jgi:hypothetical protein
VNQERLRTLVRQIVEIGPEAAVLPLPRRFKITPLRLLNEETMGPALDFFKEHAKRESCTTSMLLSLIERPDLADYFKQQGTSFSTLRMMQIRARHEYTKAPIFTVAPGLKAMLKETGLKGNIPAKFFTGPFRTSYLEFDPAEDRRVLAMSKTEPGDLVEGVFFQEQVLETPPPMPQHQREILELDPHKPVRVIDVAFTYSPINSADKAVKGAPLVLGDRMSYIQIYVQDELEPIAELLERSIHFAASDARGMETVGAENVEAFKETLRTNFSKLTKILFYMHVERKAQVKQTPAKELEERILSVGDKKKPKLQRMLNRTYDRIVVGPMTYVPLADRLSPGDKIKGRKRTHYRTSYFAIRWNGSGQAKVPELTKIKESIINEDHLKERPEREYEIR